MEILGDFQCHFRGAARAARAGGSQGAAVEEATAYGPEQEAALGQREPPRLPPICPRASGQPSLGAASLGDGLGAGGALPGHRRQGQRPQRGSSGGVPGGALQSCGDLRREVWLPPAPDRPHGVAQLSREGDDRGARQQPAPALPRPAGSGSGSFASGSGPSASTSHGGGRGATTPTSSAAATSAAAPAAVAGSKPTAALTSASPTGLCRSAAGAVQVRGAQRAALPRSGQVAAEERRRVLHATAGAATDGGKKRPGPGAQAQGDHTSASPRGSCAPRHGRPCERASGGAHQAVFGCPHFGCARAGPQAEDSDCRHCRPKAGLRPGTGPSVQQRPSTVSAKEAFPARKPTLRPASALVARLREA